VLTISGHKGNANQKGILIHCWGECKLAQSLWKTIWRLLKILNIDLPYESAIVLLGLYPKEYNSSYYRNTCTLMFIVALFLIVKLQATERDKMPHNQRMDQENVVFIHNGNFTHPQRRMTVFNLHVNGWNWRTSS
jgi:hypothetical protein